MVDVAVVAVPADRTIETIEACAERGVGAAVVFTSGFAETDADGAARQQRMGEIARASGMRILGPNCLGVYNAAIGSSQRSPPPSTSIARSPARSPS